MYTLINALLNIKDHSIKKIVSDYKNQNRVNSVGDALEKYIQDAFSGSFGLGENERNQKLSECFSYIGNNNNPPDIMLKKSDAIEVKKVTSAGSALALNSSFPKNKIYSSDTRITVACRACEDWSEKDFLYVVGVVNNEELKSLLFVYGDCFAAEKSIYERVVNTISSGVNSIPGVEFTETNELGKIKRVDPLGITDLRVRGMWHIQNPYKVFSYINDFDVNANGFVNVIISDNKFRTFDSNIVNQLISLENVFIQDVEIKDPSNPAKLIKSKYIKMEI